MELRTKEIQRIKSSVGEVDAMLWRGVKFSWSFNKDNIDYYVAEGLFLGLSDRFAYERLMIKANFNVKRYWLLTGRGKEITKIDLFGG